MGKKHKPASNVIVGGEGLPNPQSTTILPASGSRKPAAIAGALVAVALVLGLGYANFRHTDNSKSPATTPPVVDLGSPEQQYETNAKHLDAKLQGAKTPEQKSAVYSEIASNERSVSNYQAAYSAAQQAATAQQSADNYAALALAALQVGDKQAARDAYQKASEAAKDLRERGQSGYDFYQQLKAQVR